MRGGQELCGSLAPHGNRDRDQEKPHQHMLLTGPAKTHPQICCHFNWSLRQKKKKETFTVLPVKFHLTGRNDPREQSKMMEIEFKPLVCSCGSSGCRCLCAGTHRIWEVLTSLQSQGAPSVVCDSEGSRRGWGSSCSYLYCTEQLISTRKEKNNHHF